MLSRPDILVLGGGSVLGRAWMTGVLAGLEDEAGLNLHRCEHFVGTSAGSVVGALLAAGVRLERPARETGRLAGAPRPPAERAGRGGLARHAGPWALATTSPVAPVALRLGRPAGQLLRAALLHSVAPGDGDHRALRAEIEGLHSRFDGRLRVVAVDRDAGRRVVFGQPGAPPARVSDAVLASCAVPGVYSPVRIGARSYVDGGVWSPSNLDAAPAHRGTQVLCLNPLSGAPRPGGQALMRRGFVAPTLTVEALALRGRGAAVMTVGPDDASAAAIGPDLRDSGRRAEVIAAGYRQGQALASERYRGPQG